MPKVPHEGGPIKKGISAAISASSQVSTLLKTPQGWPRIVVSARCYAKMLAHAFKHPSETVNGIVLGRTEDSTPRKEQEGPAELWRNTEKQNGDGETKQIENKTNKQEEKEGESQKRECRKIKGGTSTSRMDISATSNGTSSKSQETLASPCVIYCTDVVPLFHTHILSPMTKLGFTLVDDLRSADSYIVGYYHFDYLLEPHPSKKEGKGGEREAPPITQQCKVVADEVADLCETAAVFYMDLTQLVERVRDRCLHGLMRCKGVWEEVEVFVSSAARDDAEENIANGSYLSLVDMDDHLFDPSLDMRNSQFPQTSTKEGDFEALKKEWCQT